MSSNPLSVRRVMIQTINEEGEAEGEPTFGIIASDDYTTVFNDGFQSLEDLNGVVEEKGCILDALGDYSDTFSFANREKVGKKNYYGKDWMSDY